MGEGDDKILVEEVVDDIVEALTDVGRLGCQLLGSLGSRRKALGNPAASAD